MITEDDIEDLAGPVNPALSARIQRNIDNAIERNRGTVLDRRIKLLIVAAKKDGKVGAVKEKPAFGKPDTQPADQPAGDQGIDLGGMFADTSKKVKSFAESVKNDTDEDASEDVEVQESAQDEASADVPDDYMYGLDILDDLTKNGIT